MHHNKFNAKFSSNFLCFSPQYWLDVDKQMSHQIGLTSACFNGGSGGGSVVVGNGHVMQEPLLRFCVKFYTPDPSQIEEEYTRYLFSLQIKRDLASGSLQCNENTAALMASYIVQGEKFLLVLLIVQKRIMLDFALIRAHQEPYAT